MRSELEDLREGRLGWLIYQFSGQGILVWIINGLMRDWRAILLVFVWGGIAGAIILSYSCDKYVRVRTNGPGPGRSREA